QAEVQQDIPLNRDTKIEQLETLVHIMHSEKAAIEAENVSLKENVKILDAEDADLIDQINELTVHNIT
ncbi:unnamed protein product, partial [Ilex paraguariensis]